MRYSTFELEGEIYVRRWRSRSAAVSMPGCWNMKMLDIVARRGVTASITLDSLVDLLR